MQIEVVTIGTELLLGFTIDSNGAEIGRMLAAAGVRVVRRTSIADDPAAIRDAVATALARTGAVLTTGGLGPTRDDISKKVVAAIYGWPFRFDETIWADLVARFTRLGRTIAASNRTQAEVPDGATVLPNRWGTAPGLWFDGEPGLVVMLPGVPSEMRNLLKHEVVPRLQARAGGEGRVIRSVTLRTTNIAESLLAERLGDIETTIAPVTLAYLPGVEGVDLRLTSWDLPPAESDRVLAAAREVVQGRASGVVYARDDVSLASVVLDAARRFHKTIAFAESCTGGLASEWLTAVPGSSASFVGGIVAYANSMKLDILGVPAALLDEHGAVSEQVACAMAAGVRERLSSDIAASITGIAGPDGGTDEKPVGTVWVGISTADRTVASKLQLFGSRTEIRERAAQAALLRILLALQGPLT